MQGARSRRATLHVRNAFPACNLAPRERAKTEQTLNVWLVIYRTHVPVGCSRRKCLPKSSCMMAAVPQNLMCGRSSLWCLSHVL